MKALTKEKKERQNVLIDLELVNLKNAFLLNSEEFRRKTTEAENEKLGEKKRNIRRISSNYKHNWRAHRNKRRIWTQLMLRKGWRIMNRCRNIIF